jgi:hypothetical protein
VRAALLIGAFLLVLGGIFLFRRRQGAADSLTGGSASGVKPAVAPPKPSGATLSSFLGGANAISNAGCTGFAGGSSIAGMGCKAYSYLTPLGQATVVYDNAGEISGTIVGGVKAGAGAVADASKSVYNNTIGRIF